MEVFGETAILEENTSDVEVELTIVLTSIYPQVNGEDGVVVGREETGSYNAELGVSSDGILESLESELAGGSEIIFSTTVLLAVADKLPSY